MTYRTLLFFNCGFMLVGLHSAVMFGDSFSYLMVGLFAGCAIRCAREMLRSKSTHP